MRSDGFGVLTPQDGANTVVSDYNGASNTTLLEKVEAGDLSTADILF